MFISRGFSSSQGNPRELYCTLTTFLYEHFTNKKHPVTKVKNGLDATKQENANVLLAVHIYYCLEILYLLFTNFSQLVKLNQTTLKV